MRNDSLSLIINHSLFITQAEWVSAEQDIGLEAIAFYEYQIISDVIQLVKRKCSVESLQTKIDKIKWKIQ